MARPLRIEFEGAMYHILSRGNERRDIFLDADDCETFLGVLKVMSERFGVDIFAYVLMGNHYHLLLRTTQPNLSRSMQWVGMDFYWEAKSFWTRSGRSILPGALMQSFPS